MSSLMLARHEGESILIGDDVRITVVQIRSGAVRLRVEAPRAVPIFREEIVDREPERVP